MAKMWAGRTDGAVNSLADDFNSSISFDKKMFREDILGSIAHASMLGECGILLKEEADKIIIGLDGILTDIINGTLEISSTAEDIHMFIEEVLTSRIGDLGKKLHTARSRNDQVALDLRLYLKNNCKVVKELLFSLLNVICIKAEENKQTILPGYTHLQRAQPITFAHHLLAYAEMFKRDVKRLDNAVDIMDYSPLGSCALSGTTYNTDRDYVALKLGFKGITANSIDGVSDRDFCVEILSCFAIIMMHLSRFSEEIILWSSWEFRFVELSDEFTTGSSIMPQKKNSDMAELIRGKTGRVYGNLMAILTTLKGLPLAYNKDMQEDKEGIFDALETVINCLSVFTPMLKGMKVLKDNMYKAAQKGFINATDLADYLTKKGVPFRTAYKTVGEIVGKCVKENKVLEELTLKDYKKAHELFEQDLFTEIDLKTCIEKRISKGGTGYTSVENQIKGLKEFLQNG
ncbi:MAG: argininosuccinate lyase [Clostridia bacterium]|nr:argininosuccinate lyase [Clostridia bacterium]